MQAARARGAAADPRVARRRVGLCILNFFFSPLPILGVLT